MRHIATSILFLILASACGRLERDCDTHIRGACINWGFYGPEPEAVEWIMDKTHELYSERLGVSFSQAKVAKDDDLYIMFKTGTEIASICGGDGRASGCYVYELGELYVLARPVTAYHNDENMTPRARYLYHPLTTLGHEMMHSWDYQYLQHKRPELFGDNTVEMEQAHLAEGVFSQWCTYTNTLECVEYDAKQEVIHYSQEHGV